MSYSCNKLCIVIQKVTCQRSPYLVHSNDEVASQAQDVSPASLTLPFFSEGGGLRAVQFHKCIELQLFADLIFLNQNVTY